MNFGYSRQIDWPVDTAAFAGSLARAAGEGGAWFWLDGESTDEPGRARSYLGMAAEVRSCEPGDELAFLSELREESAARRKASDASARSYSAGLRDGWVVAFGYEFGVALLGLAPEPDTAAPAFALRAETLLMLDHETGEATLFGPTADAIERTLAAHCEALRAQGDRHLEEALPPAPASVERTQVERAWRRPAEQYEADVERCRSAIRDGDAYVICLTDTATIQLDAAEPLDLFLRVRGAGRGAIIVAGDRALISASPERFLTVQGRSIATHPIKGTRPRGDTPERDAELAAELAADPKERAENLMIVDLMRNDLSRVCEPGTVTASNFLHVEPHTHVHQLVSTVEGQLTRESDVFDAIRVCMPGGSMTGAPKRRAVEILAALEGEPRGLYSGCFGWIDDGGDAELAMTIRSIELRASHRGVEARVGAGGGITYDSVPARENEEKLLKAAPLLRSLAAWAAASRYS